HPHDGRPAFEPTIYREFLTEIFASSDAIINLTTGGTFAMSLEQRLAGAMDISSEMASCNMGTMNFAIFPILDKLSDFKYDWERDFIDGTRRSIFKNTFSDIEQILVQLGKTHHTRFEFECYDVSHLYNLKHFVDKGQVEGPLF